MSDSHKQVQSDTSPSTIQPDGSNPSIDDHYYLPEPGSFGLDPEVYEGYEPEPFE